MAHNKPRSVLGFLQDFSLKVTGGMQKFREGFSPTDTGAIIVPPDDAFQSSKHPCLPPTTIPHKKQETQVTQNCSPETDPVRSLVEAFQSLTLSYSVSPLGTPENLKHISRNWYWSFVAEPFFSRVIQQTGPERYPTDQMQCFFQLRLEVPNSNQS